MRLVYFAWLREMIGKQEETIALDPQIETVAQLLDFLAKRGENYAQALVDRELVRVALDKNYAAHDSSLQGVLEVALFPPMTGG